MSILLDCSELRYAVIEALRTDADPERFVIAYGSQQALHDVIAAPRIVAFGFSSREEAEASINACGPAAVLRRKFGSPPAAAPWVQIHFEGTTT
jgi:hypothetical protein